MLLLRKMASWLLVAVISFALLEVVLRLLDEIPIHKNPLTGFHKSDPVLGWIGRPNYRARFRGRDYDVAVEYDAQGFRRATMDASEFRQDAKRIVFLGDSVTWGWGLENDETYPEQLQKMLGTGTIVNNFGVNAFGTVQELLVYDNYVQQLNPDVVAIMFVGNDLEDNLDPKDGRRPWAELVDGELIPRNQPVAKSSVGAFKSLTQKSVAFSTLKYTFHIVADSIEKKGPESQEGIKKEVDPAITQQRWQLFGALLAEFHQRCGIQNKNCSLRVIYAAGMHDVRDYESRGESRMATELERICDLEGVAFLNLRSGLFDAWQKSPDKGPNVTPLFFEHDGHMDAAGNLATAQIIFDSWGLMDD